MQDLHEHAERVNDFEEYAKRRDLPQALRDRAKESAEYRSNCLVQLNAAQVFRDLPTQLHIELFDNLYGKYVAQLPEFHGIFSKAQLQAVANALHLEIYLHGDIIIEEGRVGTRLCIMIEGRAEFFSMQSRMIFAAIHPNILFGDLAFFLPGTKQIASARAHQSCQTLQLDRQTWRNLWPDSDRLSLERQLVPVMAHKYRSTFRAYVSIMKNLELAKEKHFTGVVSESQRRRTSMRLAGSKLARVLINESTSTPQRRSSGSLLNHMGSVIKDYFVNMTDPSHTTSSSPSTALISRKSATESCVRSSQAKIRSARSEQEEMWRRHAKNLRLLKFLDDRMVEAEEALNPLHQGRATPVASHMGANYTRSSKAKARNASMCSVNVLAERSPEVSSTESPVVGRTRKGRHSIQTNPAELATKLTTLDTGSGAALFHKESDTRAAAPACDLHVDAGQSWPIAIKSNRQQHGMLKRGNTTMHLPSAPLRRVRSKSVHGLTDYTTIQHTSDEADNQYQAPAGSRPTPYDIWFDPPLPPAFTMPNSTFRSVWDVVMLLVCIYYAVMVPFRISFVQRDLMSPDSLAQWLAVEYIMDMLCVLDFVLQMHYFAFIQRGELVTDRRLIRSHYIQEGSYWADLVCILPLESVALVVSSIKHSAISWHDLFLGYRFNKILRAFHIHSYGERVQRMLIYDMGLTVLRPSVIYFLRFAFQFALGAHWVACLFYGGADYAFHNDHNAHDSWLKLPGMLSFLGCQDLSEIEKMPVLARYTRSYYFSIGAITTVSYGDIAPANAWETLVACIVIVQSVVYFGMLAAGFFQMFEMELGKRADYEERVAHIGHYMLFHRFPARTWKQMQLYFAVHWQESKGMNEDESLRGLTISVKQDIAHFVKRDFVVQMQLFRTCEQAFSRAVVAALQQELFVRNDILISAGDTGRSLFVIESGLVSVRITKKLAQRPESVEFEVIKGRYEFIGEKSLIFGIPRTATCIAMCACSVLILPFESYEKILEEFPDYREKNMREWIFTRGMAKPLKVDSVH